MRNIVTYQGYIRHKKVLILFVLLIVVLAALVAVSAGSAGLPLKEVLRPFRLWQWASVVIIFNYRLPRVIVAIVVGLAWPVQAVLCSVFFIPLASATTRSPEVHLVLHLQLF